MSPSQIPPGMMMRSFLTVASGFVAMYLASIVSMFGIGLLFFPQFAKHFNGDQDAFKQMMENNPGEAISSLMFWIVVATTVLACLAIGWFVIKAAPFGHFLHAVFVAVLVFAHHLQVVIKDTPAQKSMTLVYMIAYPLAILIGAQWAINRIVRNYEPDEEDMLDEKSLG